MACMKKRRKRKTSPQSFSRKILKPSMAPKVQRTSVETRLLMKW